MDVGELRSFIDSVRGLPEGTCPTLEELEVWLDAEAPLHERAYAASQLLTTGKTRLCFVCVYKNPNNGCARLNGMSLDDPTVLLVPALIPMTMKAATSLRRGVILRWLPRMEAAAFIEATRAAGTPAGSIASLADDPSDADALAMDVYFAHFKSKVDRHTLLLRQEPPGA